MTHQINLFNPELLPKPVVFPGWQAVALAGIVIVFTFGSGFTFKYLAQRTENENKQQTELGKDAKQKIAQLEAQQAQRKPDPKLLREIEQLREVQDRQQRALDMLLTTQNEPKAGFAESLRALARQKQEGIWLTTISFVGELRSFEGRVLNLDLLPRWLDRLAEEKSFHGNAYKVLEVTPPTPSASAPVTATAAATPAASPPPPAAKSEPGFLFKLASQPAKKAERPPANQEQP